MSTIHMLFEEYKSIEKKEQNKAKVKRTRAIYWGITALFLLFALCLLFALIYEIILLFEPEILNESLRRFLSFFSNPITILVVYGIVVGIAIFIALIDKKNKKAVRKERQEYAMRRIESFKKLLNDNDLLSEEKINYIIKLTEKRINQKKTYERAKVFTGILTVVILPIWLDFIKSELEYMIIVSTLVLTVSTAFLVIDWLVKIPERIANRHMEDMIEDLSYIRITLE